MSTLEEEARDYRTTMKEAKWFGVNEKSSKLWFSLNKSCMMGLIIDSLIDPTSDKETKDPTKMLNIVREHHSHLQSELPMTNTWEKAIDEILMGMMKTLNEKDKIEISKDIKYTEIRDALRRAPNSKAPSPDGIPNEFWKEEIKW